MKFINFFKNKKNTFSFEIDAVNLNNTSIDVNAKRTILLWHKLLKNSMDKHIIFLSKYYPKQVRNQNSWVRKSCMELSTIYYYYFVQDFTENKISAEIGQNYLSAIFCNFETLENEIQCNGFESLSDFYNKKAGYFHEVLSKNQNLSTYLSTLFIYAPLKNISPFGLYLTELDVTKIIVLEEYCSELVQIVSKESLDFVKRNKCLPFLFSIDITALEFDIKIDNSLKKMIKEEQRKLKNRIDWHIKFTSSNYAKEISKDNQMIPKTCLEFCVIYYYYFMQAFSKEKVSRDICQYYLLTLTYNFNDLYPELSDNGYSSLHEFFKVKANYFHRAINLKKGIPLGYFYNMFVATPLLNVHPLIYSFKRTELYEKDEIKLSRILGEFDFYFAKLRTAIKKEATECAVRLTKTDNTRT